MATNRRHFLKAAALAGGTAMVHGATRTAGAVAAPPAAAPGPSGEPTAGSTSAAGPPAAPPPRPRGPAPRPMKLSSRLFTAELRDVFTIATSSRSTTPIVLVEIAYEGFTGYGEASMPPYLGESQESAIAFLSRVDLSRYASSFARDDPRRPRRDHRAQHRRQGGRGPGTARPGR